MSQIDSSVEVADAAREAVGTPFANQKETKATGTASEDLSKTSESVDGDRYAWESRQGVIYESWVQLRYHKKRQMFFDRWDKATKSFTIFLGATLMGEHIKAHLTYVASAISFLSLLSLIFTYSEKKQTHKDLSEAFGSLIEDIEKISPFNVTDENTAKWMSRYVAIASKAPPPLKRLTLYCAREQTLAQGSPQHESTGLLRNWFYLFKYYF